MKGRPIGNISRRPSAWQWLVNDLPVIVLTILGIAVAGTSESPLENLLFWVSVIIAICLIYRLFYIKRMAFYVTPEQIIHEHGVFHRTKDYIELYRVIDYREDSNFFQQLFGIKTVKIFSGDKTTPRLDMIGLQKQDKIIDYIRPLVKFNRQHSGIYEITNR